MISGFHQRQTLCAGMQRPKQHDKRKDVMESPLHKGGAAIVADHLSIKLNIRIVRRHTLHPRPFRISQRSDTRTHAHFIRTTHDLAPFPGSSSAQLKREQVSGHSPDWISVQTRPPQPPSASISVPISQVGGRCVCQSAVAAQGGGTLSSLIVFRRHTYSFPLRAALVRSG